MVDGFNTDFVQDTPNSHQSPTDGFNTDFLSDEPKTDTLGHRLAREAGHVGLADLEGVSDLANLTGRGLYGIGDAVDYSTHALGSVLGLSKWKNWKDTADYRKTPLHDLLETPHSWDKSLDTYQTKDGKTKEFNDWANRNSGLTFGTTLASALIPGSEFGLVSKVTRPLTQANLLEKTADVASKAAYGQKSKIQDELESTLKNMEEKSDDLRKQYQGMDLNANVNQKKIDHQKALTNDFQNKLVHAQNLVNEIQENPAKGQKIGNALAGVSGYGLPRLAMIGAAQGAAAASDDDLSDMAKNATLGSALGLLGQPLVKGTKFLGQKLGDFLGGKNITHPVDLTPEQDEARNEAINFKVKPITGEEIGNQLKGSSQLSPLENKTDFTFANDNELLHTIENLKPTSTKESPGINLNDTSVARSWITPDDPTTITGATRRILQHVGDSTGGLNADILHNMKNTFTRDIVNPALLADPEKIHEASYSDYKPAFDALRQSDQKENSFLEPYIKQLLTGSNAYRTLLKSEDFLGHFKQLPDKADKVFKTLSPEVQARVQHALDSYDGNMDDAHKELQGIRHALEKPDEKYSAYKWEKGVTPQDKLQAFEKETDLQKTLSPDYNPYGLTNNTLKQLDDHKNLLGKDLKGSDPLQKAAYEATKEINQSFNRFKNEEINKQRGTQNYPYMENLAKLHKAIAVADLGNNFIKKFTGELDPTAQGIATSTIEGHAHEIHKLTQNLINQLGNKELKNNEFAEDLRNHADSLSWETQQIQNRYGLNKSGNQNKGRSNVPLRNLVTAANAPMIEAMNERIKSYEQNLDNKLSNASAYAKNEIFNKEHGDPIAHGLMPSVAESVHPVAGTSLRFWERLGLGSNKKALEDSGKALVQDAADHQLGLLRGKDYDFSLDPKLLNSVRSENATPEKITELEKIHERNVDYLNHVRAKTQGQVNRYTREIRDLSHLKQFRPYSTLGASLLAGNGSELLYRQQHPDN